MMTEPTASPGGAAPVRRSRWKIVAVVLVIMAILGGIAGVIAFRATAGPVDAAERFLKLNATDGPAAAWAAGSPAFQASGPVGAWEAYARATGLTEFKSASWLKREISGDTARLEGSIVTQTGKTLPTTIELVRADRLWRVQTLRLLQPGFSGGSSTGATTAETPVQGGAVTEGAVPPIAASQQGTTGAVDMVGSSTSPTSTGSLPPPNSVVQLPPPSPASGSGSSLIPTGGAMIPGAKIAGICQQKLREQTGLVFDSINCLSPLAAAPGSTTQCSVAKGAQRGTMLVTVRGIDAASQRVDFHCGVGSPQ